MRKIFLDIGAYDGNDSKWFLENNKDAEVYAFECDKRNIETIKSKKINVFLIESAAWIYNGTVKYHYGRPDGGTLISTKKTGKISSNIYYEVSCIDLAEFIESAFRKEDYIVAKMNCEGSEYKLIEHLSEKGLLSWINEWYVDWHFYKIGMPKEEHNKIASMISNKRWPLWA